MIEMKELRPNKGNQHSRTVKDNKLTPRQDLIMRLLAQGLRSKGIAAKLKVTTTTVASAVDRICAAYEAHTLAQAMAIWAVDDYREANEEEL